MAVAESTPTSPEQVALTFSSLHVALLCTAVAFAVHKTKKTPNDAAHLRRALWGLEFRAMGRRQRTVLGVLGVVGLLALFGHTATALGPRSLSLVVALVYVVLRNSGLIRFPSRVLRALLGRKSPSLPPLFPGEAAAAPLPVWVLTGFLGSGKTTLINRLVRAGEGKPRLLIIENEAGDTSLDAELVIQSSGSAESVLLVNDGCVCCKVRGDLYKLLQDEVLGRRVPLGLLDGVVIECSGLADPRAVVQTFLLDDDLRHRLELREVVAVVDAAHVGRHLGVDPACSGTRSALSRLVEEQIAFASLVVLNKVDSVRSDAVLQTLSEAVRRVNATADVLQCTYCDVDMDRVLGGRVPEPSSSPSPSPSPPSSSSTSSPWTSRASSAWSPERALVDIERVHLAVGEPRPTRKPPPVEEPPPDQNDAPSSSSRGLPTRPRPKKHQEENRAAEVRCVSVRVEGELDLDAFNRWVLRTLHDMDVLRAKGVLAVVGHDEKLAFQAVHAAFDGTPSLTSRWRPGEPRCSQIVVIGCDIQPDLIEYGLRRCLASAFAARRK